MTEKCGAIGALIVGGRVVGELRCELDAGHDVVELVAWPNEDAHPLPGTPHAVTLTWTPESEPDLDLFDPDESFDVTIPDDGELRCAVCGGRLVDVGTRASGPVYVHRDPLGKWPSHVASVA